MKVSIAWLKQLVDLKVSTEEVVKLLPLRTIAIKEVTQDFIELDMKGYNRADLLSLKGVALEVAAITNSKILFKDPGEAEFAWNLLKLPNTPIQIMEPSLAEVQCVAKIEGLTFGKSPADWVKKLASSGMREVNNIADVTNLIMLEYGQPLHSFDAKNVDKDTINVRRANNGEEITTLDHKLRKLTKDDIVLADTKKALDVAGVMGGLDSEVNENTTTILLSASIFNPEMVRQTSHSLGLSSEASKRFYHGLTKKRLLQAFNTAIKMYQDLGGRVTAITLKGNFEDKRKVVKLSRNKLENLVGVKFDDKQVEDYLTRLNFKLEEVENGWEVEVPYFRLDIDLEEDLIEEVARMYGYEKIPAEKVLESKSLQEENPIFQKIADFKDKLVNLGLTEVQTYSFITTRAQEALGINDSNREVLVKLANPMSAETEYLRQSIWPNLVEVVDKNLRQGFKDIAVFEIGKAFANMGGKPTEAYRLAIALSNGTDNPLEELASIAKQLGIEFKQTNPPALAKNLFHPKRFLTTGNGSLEEIHLRVLNNLGIEKRVAVLEISL